MPRHPLPNIQRWLQWIVPGAFGLGIIGELVTPAAWKPWVLFTALGMGIGIVVIGAAESTRLTSRVRIARGRVCVKCHYTLAGLPAPGTCPECGEPFPEDGHAARWVEVGLLTKSQT
ncbi:MAG: hypothetical protein ACKVS8_13810 [Phycisphaerales bacterium]